MKTPRKQPARDRAKLWLLQALSCGPVSVDALRFQAMKAGIAWRTLQRARIGIATAQRLGFSRGHWVWTKSAAPSHAERQQEGVCETCGREWGSAREPDKSDKPDTERSRQ